MTVASRYHLGSIDIRLQEASLPGSNPCTTPLDDFGVALGSRQVRVLVII